VAADVSPSGPLAAARTEGTGGTGHAPITRPSRWVAVARAVVAVAVGIGVSLVLAAILPRTRTVALVVLVVGIVAGVAGVVVRWRRAGGGWRAGINTVTGSAIGVLTGIAAGALLAAAGLVPTSSATAAAGTVTATTTSHLGCSCASSQQIQSLGLGHGGSVTTLAVTLGAAPVAGEQLWVWFDGHGATPVVLTSSPPGWQAEVPLGAPVTASGVAVGVSGHAVTVALTSSSNDPLAVTTSGGDRSPATGYALPGSSGPTVASLPTGARAAHLEQTRAEDQAAIATLSGPAQAFAVDLLARFESAGTDTYSLTGSGVVAGSADVLSLDDPGFREDIAAPGTVPGTQLTVVSSDIRNASTATVCQYQAPAGCTPEASGGTDSSDQVRAMEEDPLGVQVQAAPAMSVLGRQAACYRVTVSIAAGPSPGLACSFADGTLAYFQNGRQQSVLTLTKRTTSVNESLFHEETPA